MALALIHMGRWGELRQTLQTGMSLSAKNGNEPWRGIFEAMLGMAAHAGVRLRGRARYRGVPAEDV